MVARPLALLLLAAASDADLAAETAVLQAFYDEHNGPNWVVDWDFSLSVCEWTGVQCADGDAVTHVQMWNDGLTGTLPEDWPTTLPSLMDLDFGSNPGLTGTVPESWGNFSVLNHLMLGDTGLTGTLPTAITAGEGPPLLQFSFQNTLLTGPLPEAPASGCEWFSIDFSLAEIPDPVGFSGSLPESWLACSLIFVDVGNNPRVTGTIPADASWPDMVEFKVNEAALAGTIPAGVVGSAMTNLHIQNTSLVGPLPPLPDTMRSLRVDNEGINGTIPDFSNWLDFRDVVVRASQLTGGLPDLPPSCNTFGRTVDISGNTLLGGTIPPSFHTGACAENLIALVLQDNGLTGTVPAGLFNESLTPSLTTIWLDGNDFDCPLPESLFCRSPNELISVSAPKCGDVCGVSVLATTGTTVDLAFSCPDGVADDHTGFQVLVSSPGGAIACDSAVGCNVTSDYYSCNVTGLTPNSDYELRLLPTYEWGVGYTWYDTDDVLSTTQTSATTTDGLPSAVSPAVVAVAATELTVAWDPLLTVYENGGLDVSFYEVVAFPTDDNDDINPKSCRVDGADASECTLTGLEPRTEYAVRVFAENAQGPGAISDAVTKTTCSVLQRGVGAECFDCYGHGCDGSQSCRDGFDGELCGYCADGNYAFATECLSCDSVPWDGLIVLVGVAVVGPPLYKVSTSSRTMSTLFRGLCSTFQLAALVWSYVAEYSPLSRAVGSSTAMFDPNPGRLHLECLDGWTWWHTHVTTVYVIPSLIGLWFGAKALLLRRRPPKEDGEEEAAQARLRSGAVLVAGLYLVPFTRALLQTLSCVEVPSGGRVLLVDERLECDTATHLALRGVAAALFALTALLVAGLAVVLRRLAAAGRLTDADILRSYGGLYWRFKDRAVAFESELFARKILLVSVDVLLTGHSVAQVVLGVLVSSAHVGLIFWLRPFLAAKRNLALYSQRACDWAEERRLNTTLDIVNLTEFIGALVVTMIQLYALFVVVLLLPFVVQNVFIALLGLLSLGYAAWVGLAAVHEMRRGFKDPHMRASGAALRRELRSAYESMLEMAAAAKYTYAGELHVAITVFRRDKAALAGGDTTPAEAVPPPEPAVPFMEQLVAINEAAVTELHGLCRLGCVAPAATVAGGVDIRPHAAKWASQLAELEGAAAAGEAFRVAEYCRRWAPTRQVAARAELVSHAEAHVVEARTSLESALARRDLGLAHTELARLDAALAAADGVFDAPRRVRRHQRHAAAALRAAGAELVELAQRHMPAEQAGMVLGALRSSAGGGGGELGGPTQGTAFPGWAAWTARAGGVVERLQPTPELACSMFDARRERARARRRRAGAALGAGAVVALVVALALALAGGDEAAAAATVGENRVIIESDCEVYDGGVGLCTASLDGRVGTFELAGYATGTDLEQTIEMLEQVFPLLLAQGSVTIPDVDGCLDALNVLMCNVGFAACSSNCTVVDPCSSLCDDLAASCGDLGDLYEATLWADTLFYVQLAFGGTEEFTAVTSYVSHCEDRDADVWGPEGACSTEGYEDEGAMDACIA